MARSKHAPSLRSARRAATTAFAPVSRVKSDFPILTRRFYGKPLVYLDSAATSQKPREVIESVDRYYTELNANVHRGVYALSEQATEDYEAARGRVARFLGSNDPNEVVFLRGTTEALNLVAASLGRGTLERGDRVLLTVLEHHSNIVPWHILRTALGVELDFVDIDDEGRLRSNDFDAKLTRRTKVVALSHVSNVLGTVNPVREYADRAHDVGALVVVDAAQSAPHRRIRVHELGADFLAFSGHKTLGPTGIGALWGRRELLAKMPPYQGGGEMIREVHTDRVSFRDPPLRFEAGTPDVAGAHGLSVALDYLERFGFEELARQERDVLDYTLTRLEEVFGPAVHLFGPKGHDRSAIVPFMLEGVHPHDVASLLDADGIAIRAGHHCAQPLMERLGVPALCRASFYLYNGREDVDRLISGLQRVAGLFGTPAAA